MKSILKSICFGAVACLLLASCEKEDKRTVFPHSTPVIEEASINPNPFVYGDTITVSAKISDPTTPLSTIKIQLTVNDVLFAEAIIRTPGKNVNIEHKIATEFLPQLPHNANIQMIATLTNVEGDRVETQIEGVKGLRKRYERLYLVLRDGQVFPLTPNNTNADKYETSGLNLSNNVSYRIAEKITSDNQIDFSGDVFGDKQGYMRLVDEYGGYLTVADPMLQSVDGFAFDSYLFRSSLVGSGLSGLTDLDLSMFTTDVTIDGEAFKQGAFYVEKGGVITLAADVADAVFNLDYFERVSSTSIKYIAETGPVTLYYNTVRKNVVVEQASNTYPDVLFVCGEGLSYPSKVKTEATTGWGFDHISKFVYFRKIAGDTYQGTVYIDATKCNFKPFENRDWGNEKKSTGFTMPSILLTDTDAGKTDGNWYGSPTATSGVYKLTINLGTKVATAEKIVLP